MSTTIDIPRIRYDLNQVRLNLQAGQTRKEILIADEANEVTRVGLAKGRLELKDQIDKFLLAYQATKYEQTVGIYRNLLSAIVHDVIDPTVNIDLVLTTERGLPSLEVMAYNVDQPDRKVNVYTGCGGALINVVSAGLRAIAVARSGLQPFLILDEADCWITPSRVPMFFNVLQGLCRDLKFQMLVISHHPRATYGDCHIIDAKELITQIPVLDDFGEPSGRYITEKSLVATSPDTKAAWVGYQGTAFRSIHYNNFAAMIDQTIDLVPGLNVICGDNNTGKSRFFKAFRSAFYGGSDDGDIRLGCTQTSVEFFRNDGYSLEFSRVKKRNPINLWRIYQPGDTSKDERKIATIDNDRCEAGGRDVPDWVGKVFKIHNQSEMELQFGAQLQPVFGIDKPGPQQAALLSTGRETSGIRAMMAKHKENVAADNQIVKQGEKAIVAMRETLALMPDYDEIARQLEGSDTVLDQMTADQARIKAAEDLAAMIAKTMLDQARLKSEIEIVGGLPDALPQIVDAMPIKANLAEIWSLSEKQHATQALLTTLDALPASEPEMVDLTPYITAINDIDEATAELEICQAQVAALSHLPDAAPVLKDAQLVRTAAGYIRDMTTRYQVADRESRLLAMLPQTALTLDTTRSAAVRSEVAALRDALKSVAAMEARQRAIDQEIVEKEAVVAKLRAEVGDECPICSNPMGDILHKHDKEPAVLIAEAVAAPVVVSVTPVPPKFVPAKPASGLLKTPRPPVFPASPGSRG
jgi:hypothetical protein